MASKHFATYRAAIFNIFVLAALAGSSFLSAGTAQVIYSFGGGPDGEYADTDLVIDRAGNLYGTTVEGGQFGSGTVFELSPSANGWSHKVLYSFTSGSDGAQPYKGVTLDGTGELYGTAGVGGLYTGPCVDSGCGVVYKLTNSGGTWTQTVIHQFTGGADGYGPGSGVTIDGRGNVYGTTPVGGKFGLGIVYQLHRDGQGNWAEKVIHTFTGGADGAGGSAGRLLLDANGSLYGLCTTGGVHGAGTVFELTPTPSGEWNSTTLYAFQGEPNAGFPYGGLVGDGQGNLYGTTYYAGGHDLGTIYRLSRRNGVWTETALYSFKGGADGSSPISNLVAASDGNLYGTTSEGGAACSCGAIFKLAVNGGTFNYSVSYRFKGMPDGGFVYNGMIADPAGTTLYGATVHGGLTNDGTIYKFVP